MSPSVVELGTSPAGDPSWVVKDYQTIRRLLFDGRLNRFPPVDVECPARFTHAEIIRFKHLDPNAPPPPDDLIRRTVAHAFSKRRMHAIEAKVEAITTSLIDAMIAAGPPAELRRDFAGPLSSQVISSLIGVPDEDHQLIQELSQSAANLAEPEISAPADQQLKDYMRQLVAKKEADLGDDVISDIIRLRVDHPALENVDLVIGLATGLRFAGQINTVTLIDRGIVHLLRHPEFQAEIVVGDRAARARVVEEILRLPHPVQGRVAGVPRYATVDFELGGCTIRRGDLVVMDIEAGNLDPSVFADPGDFCPARPATSHLSFGAGTHYCVGAALARCEMETAFAMLLGRLPELRFAVPFEELEPLSHELSGGATRIPITWKVSQSC